MKLIVATLSASALLVAAVSTASARNLSVTNQNIRATWSTLEFIAPGANTVRCRVTLEGSLHRGTMPKVARSLIGAITRARFQQETCTGGRAAAFNGVETYNGAVTPNTLPWQLTYEGFTGTLPNLTSVLLLLSRFRIGGTAAFCAAQYGNETDNVTLRAGREAIGGITELEPVAGRNNMTLIMVDGGFGCPAVVTLAGRGRIALLGNTTRITVNLI